MDWQKVITDSQAPIYLLAISYFIKRFFDLKSKKVEVNHSLFQQNKLSAVNNFFRCYAKAELMWNQFEIWNMLSNKLTVTEIDKFVWPPLNDLKQSVLELQVYFESDLHNHFKVILENFLSLNGGLHKLYFYPKPEENILHRVNKFEEIKTNIITKNEVTLTIISRLVKESFK